MADQSKPPKGPPSADEADIEEGYDSISEILQGDFELNLGDGEALGDLLGAPPALPPAPSGETQVFTSAPRPAAAEPRLPAARLEAAPTDDEVFGTGAGQETLEVDAAFVRALLADEKPTEDRPRRPNVVRREPPPRQETERDEATRISDLSELAARAITADPPPAGPPSVELDESFYDGIEIGAGDPNAQAAASPQQAPHRVSRNVVRRVSRAEILAPTQEGEQVFEDNGEFLARTPVVKLDAETAAKLGMHGSGSATASAPAPVPTPREEQTFVGPPPLELDASVTLDTAPAAEDEFPESQTLVTLGPAAVTAPVVEEPPAAATIDEALPAAAPDAAPDPVLLPEPTAPTLAARRPTMPPPEVARGTLVDGLPNLPIEPARFLVTESSAAPLDPDDEAARAELVEIERELAALLPRAPTGEPAPDPTDPGRAARLHLAAAHAAERAGDTGLAREHYEQACLTDQALLPAARGLRKLLMSAGEHLAAVRHLELEVQLGSPAERSALAALRADLLVAVGEQDLARVAFGDLVDAHHDDVRALLGAVELAASDERDDELAEALTALAPLVADLPLRAALTALRGRVHERLGQPIEAARAYADSAAVAAEIPAAPKSEDSERDTSSPDRPARFGQWRLALASGEAATAAAAALVAKSDDVALRAAVGRRRALAARAADDAPAAVAILEEVAAVDDPLVLEHMADVYEQAGKPAETALALYAWAKCEPWAARRAQVLRRLARLQAGTLNEPAGAMTALRQAAQADPGDTAALAEIEALLVQSGDIDGAVALCRAEAEQPGGSLFARLRGARHLEQAGRFADAAAELKAARAVAPGSPIVIEALARVLARAGDHAALAQLYGETADVAAHDPAAARERSARALEEHARDVAVAPAEAAPALVAAEAAWRAVLAADPGALVAHLALERLAVERKDVAAEQAALAAQLENAGDPARAAALAVRRGMLALDEPAAAGGAFAQALALDRLDPRAHGWLLALSAAAGDWADVAERLIERGEALSDGPEKDASRLRAAAVLQDQGGEHTRAAALLAPLVAAHPRFAAASARLALAARSLGDAAGQAALLQDEVRLRAGESTGLPIRVANLVRLGETLAWRVGEPKRAAAAFREALAAQPDDALAREGFARVAVAADELAPLADLALADLKRAEERDDVPAKITAYEELARIDGDLRGDSASALLAWEAAASLDPGRATALRALERSYLAEGRTADLLPVYAKLVTALAAAPHDALAIVLETARLHDAQGEATAALSAYRDAYALAPGTRRALFRLEARARDAGRLEDLVRLDEGVAQIFADDPRTHAAFLTRAGEVLADLGRPDDAVLRFRAATAALPGHAPALRAWRRVALLAGRWADVVDACELEAASPATTRDVDRVALLHLAGVAAMDHSGDLERATAALRHVLALDPRHEDAFARLRDLHAREGRHTDLADLLSARVAIETHPPRLVELHQTLAALYREDLNDAERAKQHLRAVLARDPGNLAAVSTLSDLTYENGQWAEAAEALIARGKLEKSPQVLKEIFFRLGVIYSEKLPDPRWASKSFEQVLAYDPSHVPALVRLAELAITEQNWRLALGATERLLELESEPVAKVEHLHRIARISDEGFGDRKHAEDALRRAVDVDPTSSTALVTLIEFYERDHDTSSLRVHLDRVLAAMRARVERDPLDGIAHRVLARALLARAQANVPGSTEAARCAAELSETLGTAEAAERALAEDARNQIPSAKGLGDLRIDELLFHPTVPGGFRHVFRLLFDVLTKRYQPDLRRWGVGRPERLPRSGHPVRDVIAEVAAELGVVDFEVYVSTTRPGALGVELTDPMSVVLGANLAAMGKPALRFAAARVLKLAVSYMAIPAGLTPDELGVLLAAIIRQYDPQYTPPAINIGAVVEEARALGRLIPKRLRDEIVRFAGEISGQALDHRVFWQGIQHSGNRAGLVASGRVLAGVDVLARMGGHADLGAARTDPQIAELINFSVSNEHCEIRAALDS